MRKSILCFVLIIVVLALCLSPAAATGWKQGMQASGQYRYMFNKDKKTIAYAGYQEKEFADTARLSIKSYTVPETIDGYTVTALYDYAFSSWRSLTDLKLPNTIKYIGEYAFANCGLRDLELPEGVEEIGAKAFGVGLSRLVLPSTVKKIDKTAFDQCKNYLKEVVVVKGSYAENFCKKMDLPFSYGNSEEGVNEKDSGDSAGTHAEQTGDIQAWYDYGVGLYLPKPILSSGEEPQIDSNIMNNRDAFYAVVTNAGLVDFEKYIRLMKKYGYTINDRSDTHAEVSNEDGYKVFIMYDASMGMEVSCMGPVPGGDIGNETATSEEEPQEINKENETRESSNNDENATGFLVLGIPWGGSYIDYCKALLDQGFVDDFSYQFFADSPLDYASIYLGDEKVLEAFAPKGETTYVYDSKGLGGQSLTTPVKKYGGLVCREFDLYCYYGSGQSGNIDNQESHTYAATVDFDSNQDGKELLGKLKGKYDEPQLYEGDNLRAYLWSKDNMRLVYYTDAQDMAYTLWFINSEASDALAERIRNYTGLELEDAGL